MALELEAITRDKTGKGGARSVRRDLKVPAVLYGPKTQATSLSVSALHLEKLLRETGGESKLLNLKIDGRPSQAGAHSRNSEAPLPEAFSARRFL